MPWTESRSRDEWLAEVQRRGGRIRRRRRLLASGLGALALVLPVSALVSFTGEPDRQVRLAAGGPAPAPTDAPRPENAGPATGAGAGASPAVAPAEPGAPAAPAPTVTMPGDGTLPPTTAAEVHGRVAVINGRSEPTSPASSVPGDNPVVRVSPTSPPSTTPSTGGTSRSASSGPATSAIPGPDLQSSTPACPSDGVRVVVGAEQTSYAPGQTVRWTSTLENRSSVACLLPSRAFFRVEDAAGRSVGQFAYTMEYRMPVKAEPGKVFTSSLSWDQKDCSGPACAQVPAGTYVVVADWTEGGPYTASASFQIGA